MLYSHSLQFIKGNFIIKEEMNAMKMYVQSKQNCQNLLKCPSPLSLPPALWGTRGIPMCFQASWEKCSFPCVLGLPWGLFPVEHAQNNSPKRHSIQMLNPPQLAPFLCRTVLYFKPLLSDCATHPISEDQAFCVYLQSFSPHCHRWE